MASSIVTALTVQCLGPVHGNDLGQYAVVSGGIALLFCCAVYVCVHACVRSCVRACVC